MMKLDAVLLLVLGYFIEFANSGHHKHVKIIVPQYFHKHTAYKKVPVHHHCHNKKPIVIHKHKHKHDHGHIHKVHPYHKHKHQHIKYGHDDHGFHGYGNYKAPPIHSKNNYDEEKTHDDFNIDPVFLDNDDGYHTSKKSIKTEHYEVESIDPNAKWPDEKHVVRGSYKVEETDPYDFTTTSHHSYDSPLTKEIAQALTNFGGKYDNLYPYKTEKETEKSHEAEEGEGEEEKPTDANENVAENYEKGDYKHYQFYDDYGDRNEATKQHAYTSDPESAEYNDVDYSNFGGNSIENYIHQRIYGGPDS